MPIPTLFRAGLAGLFPLACAGASWTFVMVDVLRALPAGVDRWRSPLAGALAAAALAALVLWRDPHEAGALGACPSFALLGVYCPGCGSLRACHDLLTGQVVEAVGHNVLLLPALAWLAWWWTAQVLLAAGRPIRPPWSSGRFAYALLVVVIAFALVRNIPGSPLAP